MHPYAKKPKPPLTMSYSRVPDDSSFMRLHLSTGGPDKRIAGSVRLMDPTGRLVQEHRVCVSGREPAAVLCGPLPDTTTLTVLLQHRDDVHVLGMLQTTTLEFRAEEALKYGKVSLFLSLMSRAVAGPIPRRIGTILPMCWPQLVKVAMHLSMPPLWRLHSMRFVATRLCEASGLQMARDALVRNAKGIVAAEDPGEDAWFQLPGNHRLALLSTDKWAVNVDAAKLEDSMTTVLASVFEQRGPFALDVHLKRRSVGPAASVHGHGVTVDVLMRYVRWAAHVVFEEIDGEQWPVRDSVVPIAVVQAFVAGTACLLLHTGSGPGLTFPLPVLLALMGQQCTPRPTRDETYLPARAVEYVRTVEEASPEELEELGLAAKVLGVDTPFELVTAANRATVTEAVRRFFWEDAIGSPALLVDVRPAFETLFGAFHLSVLQPHELRAVLRGPELSLPTWKAVCVVLMDDDLPRELETLCIDALFDAMALMDAETLERWAVFWTGSPLRPCAEPGMPGCMLRVRSTPTLPPRLIAAHTCEQSIEVPLAYLMDSSAELLRQMHRTMSLNTAFGEVQFGSE
jgi:hypothetical protein